MEKYIVDEKIAVTLDLAEWEVELLTKKMCLGRAVAEFDKYITFQTKNTANASNYYMHIKGQICIFITLQSYRVNIHDFVRKIQFVESILMDFLYYISMLGYQPELYQGDPVRCKLENNLHNKQIDKYLRSQSYGLKFIIKKEND